MTGTAQDRLQALLAARPSRGIPPRPEPGAPAPLSPSQRAMWLAWQQDPDNPAYNVPVPLRFRGPLDADALLGAVREVAERHEVLRGVVVTGADGVPLMRALPASAVPVERSSLDGVSWEAAVARQSRRPFRLDRDPPMRVHLWRTADGEHLLLLMFHHIALDAWSRGLLLDDLLACYRGDPPPVRLQHADYAQWASGRRLDDDVRWWCRRLAGLPPALELPTDRPATADWAGARVPLALSPSLSSRLRDFATAHGCSPFMVLLTALQVLMARLSGGTDIAIGVPESGRHHEDTETMLGSFLNTLVIRREVDLDRTGLELLTGTRGEVLDAFSHARAPFAQVVERLRPARVAGVTPLFRVLLNVYPVEASALDAELLDAPVVAAKFDLSFNVIDRGDGFDGFLIYRSAAFEAETASALSGWYMTVLDGLLAAPEVPAGDLPLEPPTTPASAGGLVSQRTPLSPGSSSSEGAPASVGTPSPLGSSSAHGAPGQVAARPVLAGPVRPIPTDMPLHVLFERQADQRPDAIAVEAPDGRLTYAELDRRANRVAHHLLRAGVRAGDPVGVVEPRGTRLMVALLGVLKAGAAHVAIDPDYPPGRIRSMLARARLTLDLDAADRPASPASGHAAGHLSGAASGLASGLDVKEGGDEWPDHRPAVAVGPDDPAYVVFTSGSTGEPKGVVVEHRHITHYLHAALARMGQAASGRFALVSTIAADLGLTNVYGALTTGGTLCLIDRETAADPAALARHTPSIDVLKLVPSHLEMLAAHGDLAAVLPRRLLILAGEPCPWELVRRVRSARPDLVIYNSYGPAETTVAAFMYEVTADGGDGIVPLGEPLANVECRVTDPAGRPLPWGVPGELWIGGPTVARGYLGVSSDRFTGGYYRTGDRVRVRRDGMVDFLGRLDDQVKVRGYRVELGEVTAALRAVPGVAEAVALPVGEGHQRRLAAWVAPSGVDAAKVRERLREKLPDYMVPASIVVMDRIPLNPNGKVDRAALPSPGAAAREAPTGPDETTVAQAWQSVLGVTGIGRDDDFFALGGDSFQAVRAVQAIGAGLRVIDLFAHPTVRELARLLGTRSRPGGGLLHRLGGPVSNPDLTVVCVPYGGGSAAAYRPLAQALGDRITTLAAELPGHDPARPDEPLLPLAELVDRLADEIRGTVTGRLIVYGHCVGTATATALVQRLEALLVPVEALVVGASFPFARLPGRISTWISRWLPSDRLTSDRAYRDLLRVMGGLEELDEAQTETMMRSLRHDARVAENWFTEQLTGPPTAKLRAPMLCVIGERDRGTELYQERYREWGAFSDRVTLATIPRAAHYFLKHQSAHLAAAITSFDPSRQPDPPPQAPRSLRAFYTVAFGQTVSLVGNALSAFALGVWAYQRSGQVADYALVAMLAILPAIVFAPLGGAVADRIDRRRVMLACDAVSIGVMLALVAVYFSGGLTLWHVATVSGVTALVTAFHRPAYLAAVAQLVPKPYLAQANALAQLGTGVGMLIAPLAGGALLVAVGLPWVVAIDVLSFLAGLVTLLLVRFPDRLFRRREETFRQAIVGGWRYLIRRRPLVVMTVYFVVVNYLFTIAVVISTPLVLALGDAADLGIVTAASGLGAAAGSIAMVIWGGTRRKADGMVGFVIGLGAGIALMGLRPSILLIGIGAAVWWASLSILNAHWISMIQLKVGLDLQGRVLATNQMLAVAMTPLAYFTAPMLHQAVGSMSLLLLICGLLLVGWGFAGLGYRPLRRMEDDLPNAVTGPEVADDLDVVQAEADRRLS